MPDIERQAELSPELADLHQHEQVIEQGLTSFVEVGMALLAIKANKKYRYAGYDTFEDYCDRRWNIGRAHGNRLVLAASTAQSILSPKGDIPAPTRETQVRPLTLLRNDDDKREAWVEAVKEADGGQPTAAQVGRAVAKRQPVIKTAKQQQAEREAEDAYFRAEARRQFNFSMGNALFSLSVLADNPDKLTDFVAGYEAPPATPLTTDEIKAVGRAIDQMINEWRYP